jgi:hypothetical protein
MIEKLIKIQQELKVPKSQYNAFGKYNYRSCEDIVEHAKPVCEKNDCTLTLSDEVVEVGGRVFVKATAKVATVTNESTLSEISATGFAEVAKEKKGMDLAQITGSASSYARKYALNGLFAIDDTKDDDSTNTHGKTAQKPEMSLSDALEKLSTATTPDEARDLYAKLPKHLRDDGEVQAKGAEIVKALTK